MSSPSFDPRHWNLVVGATLALGCAGRSISLEAEESADQTSGELESSSEGTEPECITNADCPTYFECVDNVCEYIGYVDTLDWDEGYEWVDEGYEWVDEGYEYNYQCFEDLDCPEYEICDYEQCIPVGEAPPACGLEVPVPRVLDPGGVLGLTFVDFDADGREELAVATQDDFLIYSADSDVPLVVPRPAPSPEGQIVGGAFDGDPGEDLVLADPGVGLVLYSSNTVDAFTGPMLIPGTDAYLTWDMTAGDLDGVAPEDLVLTTSNGVQLVVGGASSDLVVGRVQAAGVLDRSHVDMGIAVSTADSVLRFGLDGAWLGEELLGADTLVTMIIANGGVAVGAEPRGWGWHWLRGHDLTVGAPSVQAVPPPDQTHLCIGDHDGDGDEEFALVLDGGAIAVVDYEP